MCVGGVSDGGCDVDVIGVCIGTGEYDGVTYAGGVGGTIGICVAGVEGVVGVNYVLYHE